MKNIASLVSVLGFAQSIETKSFLNSLKEKAGDSGVLDFTLKSGKKVVPPYFDNQISNLNN